MLFDSKPGRSFENFLRDKEEARERYYAIMSLCRFGCRWSDVKRMLAVREGYEVDDKKVTELLQNLMDALFLTKENDLYRPSDLLIARAF